MNLNPEQKDLDVGRRIKARRLEKGLTQTDLAEAVKIKFQQIQKYETGANRVSASRLWHISRVLDAPVGWFFEGDQWEQNDSESVSIMGDAPTMRLVRWYREMPKAKKLILREIARIFAGGDLDGEA